MKGWVALRKNFPCQGDAGGSPYINKYLFINSQKKE